MTSVNLQEFNIKEQEAGHIAHVLESNQVSIILNFSYHWYHRMQTLTVLNIAWNALGDSGLCSLSEGLQKNRVIFIRFSVLSMSNLSILCFFLRHWKSFILVTPELETPA